jgi:hypothetical protein
MGGKHAIRKLALVPFDNPATPKVIVWVEEQSVETGLPREKRITMDLIATSIISAVTVGLGKIGGSVIEDSYKGLKAILIRKFGGDSDLVMAVQHVEQKPESPARKELLMEEIAAAKAEQDDEIVKAAQVLLEHIKTWPGAEEHVQQAIGNYIAQADRGGSATVNVDRAREGVHDKTKTG